MTAHSGSRPSDQGVVGMLRAELAWYPGRPALVGRMVLACTSVVLWAVVFQIPGAVLGAGFPILISRENLKATQKTAFQIALACCIATAVIIVGGMLTAGSPFLHVLWVIVSLFAAFYAISSLNFANASLTASAVLALAIRTWDYPILAKVRVERTLYTLLAILVGCIVTVLIEAVFSKRNLPDAVVEGISLRLNLMKTLLSGASAGESASPALAIQLTRSAAKGVDDLCRLLAASSYDAGSQDLLATVIAFTRQLIELGSTLGESAPLLSTEDRERCQNIARNLGAVRSSLVRMQPPQWVDLPFASHASNPVLLEIERTTALLAQTFTDESLRIRCLLPAEVPAVSIGQFVADAVRNTEHFKFAVRGTLSAFLCYVFFMSTGWMGLGTLSILTCALTARRLTGASRQRQSLRFAGFFVGAGIFGLGSEVFLLPQLDTIAGYALLFASVVWIGSWVATSGPRIAFSGFQIVLAFSLVNLNTFTLNTSPVPSRDAVLGIILGVAAMWLVFDHLWAKTSSASVRDLLLRTLREVAHFKAVSMGSFRVDNQRLLAESSKISRDLDKLRDLADFYDFESFPKKPNESLVNRSIRTLLPQLRALLLVKAGLLQHRGLVAAEGYEVLVQQVEERASAVLSRLADAIEAESPELFSSWNGDIQELRAKVSIEEAKAREVKNLPAHTQMRLSISLLDLASDLERQTRLNFVLETDVVKVSGKWPVGTLAENHGTISRTD
jgi:multidrug resistance protein MdtO